jgi:hypothetical protein
MAELPPKTPKANDVRLRAKEDQNQAYKQVLLCVFIATLFVTVVLIVAFAFSAFGAIFLFVVGAGVVGALFSSLLRLYHYEDLPKALTGSSGVKNFYLVIYAILPLMIGGIAATVLYLAFMSGLLKGDLFPIFVCPPDDTKCGLEKFAPNGPDHQAKALVWAFLSGFSERLVPDLLQNIAKKTNDK